MRYLTLVLCTLMPAALAAQTAEAPVVLTLEDAIAQGLANSQRLAELQSRAEAAEFAMAGRGAADMPVLALQGGYTRTNHVPEFSITFPLRPPQVVYPDIPNNYRARLDLQWPIYTGGRVDALERAAHAERFAATQDVATARADLRLEVTRAYWAAVTAGEAEAVVRRSLEAVDAHVSDVRARLAAGLVPPNDVASAEAQASRQRLLALEAANQRQIAEADLRRLTANEALVLRLVPKNGDGPRFEKGDSPRLAQLVSDARTLRPERVALEQRAAAADLRAAAVAAAGKPQVAFGGGYDYARPNPRIFPRSGDWMTSWDVSVNATWTLWDGGRRGAEHGEALANAAALKARVADFDRQLTFDVRARSFELESSRQAILTADEGIRAATEAERVVGERFKAGVVTSTDVLDAQIARLQAELDRTRAVATARLAEARLERALGR